MDSDRAKVEVVVVCIGLVNPKDAINVGAVLRAVGCYAADDVFYSGDRYDYAARHSTDTKKILRTKNIHKVDTFLDVKAKLPAGTKIVCIELVVGATPLPDYVHPQEAIYIFGPEDGSLPKDLVQVADDVVYIPTIGCMNLAATVNVVLYDRLVKMGSSSLVLQGDDLIRKSRDNKNRLRVPSTE